MIHHPKLKIIQSYADGELNNSLSLMVSCHIGVCEECRMKYTNILQHAADKFESSSESISEIELDRAFDQVLSALDEINPLDSSHTKSEPVQITVSGQVIPLPVSMNFLKGQQIPWKEFGKKNAIAPLVTSPEGNFYLIYIGPGERVPEHNHSGTEYSYVAAGSYNDGISTFNTGDFSSSDHEVHHSPCATSDDGCLVISWVEGRLNYFDGWLKPLNSILWWYLHRA